MNARRSVAVPALIVGLVLVVSSCATADRSVSVESAGTRTSPRAPDVAAAPADPGSSSSSVTPARFVVAAAAATEEISTGRFELTAATSGERGGSLSVAGSFDRSNDAVRIEAVGGRAKSSVEVLTVGGTAYVKPGPLGDLVGDVLGVDTPWISLDVDKFTDGRGVGDLFPGTDPGSDPRSFLDLLKGASGEVKTIGTEDVRGDSTTHYRAEVIPSKALAEIDADRQDKLREVFGASLDKPIPVDVWIDDAGRLRKGVLTRDAGSDQNVTVTFELFALGQAVSITAPPADQVTPAESIPLLKDLLGN